MKKLMAILTACLLLAMAGCGGGQPDSEEAENPVQAEETAETPAEAVEDAETTQEDERTRFLSELVGTYQELFPVLCREEYRQLWLDDCAAVVGADSVSGRRRVLLFLPPGRGAVHL